MCNLYLITTNQAATSALFRVINRYIGNLAPMPGVFPDPRAPGAEGRELVTARWGMTPPRGRHSPLSMLARSRRCHFWSEPV